MCTRRTFLLHIMFQIQKLKNHFHYDRDTKNKAEELDRLHADMKEKLVTASNTEKLQILTLVPDSCSRKYCSEYFGVSVYLIRSARELQQRKWILAQPSQKKGKAMAQNQMILFMLSMRMINTADSFPATRIMQAYRKVFTNKSSQFCAISMNCLLHIKEETLM